MHEYTNIENSSYIIGNNDGELVHISHTPAQDFFQVNFQNKEKRVPSPEQNTGKFCRPVKLTRLLKSRLQSIYLRIFLNLFNNKYVRLS